MSQAIARAGSEDVAVIEIANDIYLDAVIEINSSIILRASEGIEAVSLYSPENLRHFVIKGEEIYFATENVIIDGENSGGGIQSTANHLILDIIICNTNNASYGAIKSSGNLTVNGGVYFDNVVTTSAGYGGAIYHSGNLIINDGEFFGNTATSGGAIYGTGESNINGGEIYNNIAKYGGGVYFNRNATINGGEIHSNIATSYGGGVYDFGRLVIDGGLIFDNTAEERGGGIYVHREYTIQIDSGKIYNNTSAIWGGGIFGEVELNMAINETAIYNNAAETGGGIFVEDLSELKISNSAVKDNHAAQAFQMIDEADIALHNQQIANDVIWTAGFEYIYNNLDIGYTKGIPIEVEQHTVTIMIQYPEGTIEDQIFTYSVLSGDSFAETFEVEAGYHVAGIQMEKGVDVDFINKIIKIETVNEDMSVIVVCR